MTPIERARESARERLVIAAIEVISRMECRRGEPFARIPFGPINDLGRILAEMNRAGDLPADWKTATVAASTHARHDQQRDKPAPIDPSASPETPGTC